MKYIILYPFINLFLLLVYAFVNLNLQLLRAMWLMLWDLDKAYENEVLKKTKEYREFENQLNEMI